MPLFVWILLVLGAVMTALKLTLLERRRIMIPMAVAISACPVLLLPWSVRLPWPQVMAWAGNKEIVQALCILLTIESVGLLLLGLHLIRLHHEDQRLTPGKVIALSPAPALLVALAISQVYGLHVVTGMPFVVVAIGGASLAAGALSGLTLILRWGLPAWVTRLEALVLIAFGQLLLAMFLPLALGGVSTPAEVMRTNWPATAVVTLLMLLGGAGGWMWRRYREATS